MKISVIISTFNSEQTISECLLSLSKQTYQPYEIIVVDRRSADSTIKKVREFQGVKLIINVEPITQGSALNRGAEIAVGDIIFFTDADCIVDQKALEYHMKAYKNREDISGVMGSTNNAGPRTLVSDFVQRERIANQWVGNLNPDGTCKLSGNQNFSIYRSDFLERQFKEDLVASQDTEFSIRIYGELKILFEPRSIVFHHHPTTIKALFRQRKWYGEGLFGLIKYCKRESFNPNSLIYSALRYLDFSEAYLHKAIFQDNRLLCNGCRIQKCKIDSPKLPKNKESDEYLCRVICLGYASGVLKQRTGYENFW